jgi:hypothetical protein
VDAERSASGSHTGDAPPATRHRALASGTYRALSRLSSRGPRHLGMSPDGDPVFTLQPTRLRVSARSGAAGPVRGTPTQANSPRKRNDHVVFNGLREGLPPHGERREGGVVQLEPPHARPRLGERHRQPPSFQANIPTAPRSRHPSPTCADDFPLPAGGGSDASLQYTGPSRRIPRGAPPAIRDLGAIPKSRAVPAGPFTERTSPQPGQPCVFIWRNPRRGTRSGMWTCLCSIHSDKGCAR